MANDGAKGGMPDGRDFDEIFNTYYLVLVKFAITRGATYQDAVDAVQDAFDAFRERPHYWSTPKILFTIVLRKLADRRRERRRDARLNDAYKARQDQDRIDRTASFDDLAIRAVPAALLDLPADMQSLLFLRYTENKSIREISLLLSQSAKTVRGALPRAREALRLALAARGVTAATAFAR